MTNTGVKYVARYPKINFYLRSMLLVCIKLEHSSNVLIVSKYSVTRLNLKNIHLFIVKTKLVFVMNVE